MGHMLILKTKQNKKMFKQVHIKIITMDNKIIKQTVKKNKNKLMNQTKLN